MVTFLLFVISDCHLSGGARLQSKSTSASALYVYPSNVLFDKDQRCLLKVMNSICVDLFGYRLRNEQQSAVFHLLTRHRLLLSSKTGSGKSTVAYLCGVMLGGIVLYISPLLSLGAQAFSKVLRLSGTSPSGCIDMVSIWMILGQKKKK